MDRTPLRAAEISFAMKRTVQMPLHEAGIDGIDH